MRDPVTTPRSMAQRSIARAVKLADAHGAFAFSFLVLLGALLVAAAISTAGCSSVPSSIVTGVAVLDSNTHTLSNHYRRAIAGQVPAGDDAKHDMELMSVNDQLADKLAEWTASHEKGK